MVNIRICVGTACYIMGSADLMSIKEQLTAEELTQINIEGSNCLGCCKGYNPQNPYVQVNDEIFENVSVESLLMQIRLALKEA
ncbi:MAG: NAD(P)H-dependent oxidoreductase subunit E [Lentisphaeria bacterium]|nr:NAD(P)H-dependent oxidoreductase subunit E [Lentisphaeria bacterium]